MTSRLTLLYDYESYLFLQNPRKCLRDLQSSPLFPCLRSLNSITFCDIKVQVFSFSYRHNNSILEQPFRFYKWESENSSSYWLQLVNIFQCNLFSRTAFANFKSFLWSDKSLIKSLLWAVTFLWTCNFLSLLVPVLEAAGWASIYKAMPASLWTCLWNENSLPAAMLSMPRLHMHPDVCGRS